MVEKRYPHEWERIKGVKILDPDGWKFSHGQLKPKVYHKQISAREFYRRMMYSTIKPK